MQSWKEKHLQSQSMFAVNLSAIMWKKYQSELIQVILRLTFLNSLHNIHCVYICLAARKTFRGMLFFRAHLSNKKKNKNQLSCSKNQIFPTAQSKYTPKIITLIDASETLQHLKGTL